MRRTLSTLLLVGALAVSAIAPAAARPAQAGPPDTFTIVDQAVEINAASGEFSQLIAAVVRLNLVDTLDGRRQFTVFAPTDAAFANLYAVANTLQDDVTVSNVDTLVDALGEDLVREVVLFHVAPGERFSGDVLSSDTIPTLQGEKIVVDGTTVSGAQIAIDAGLFDVDVDNGVIHVVNAVMLPPSIAAAL